MHMLSLLLLTCSILPMLYGAAGTSYLTLSEDEQHALNLRNFRSGFCGYVSDDCRATHDAVFPPLAEPTTLVSFAAWMQKRGFTVCNTCILASIFLIPTCAVSYGMGIFDGTCYTLSSAASHKVLNTCCASTPPAIVASAMTFGHTTHTNNVPRSSFAELIDMSIVAWASDKWRKPAPVSERTALLSKPQPVVMTLDRDEA